MKIVAIDFETANNSPCSACSIGIVSFDSGVIEEEKEIYFKLHPRYNFFTNTHIHGITKEMVQDEQEFDYYYDYLKETLENNIVVAHNARFDVNVLNSECELYGKEIISFKYIDTVEISRAVYPELYNHKLDTIAKYLNISLNHHNASSDAYCCLLILIKAMEAYNIYEIEEFIKKGRFKVKNNILSC